MATSVVDLLNGVGLENVAVQFLPDSITGAKQVKGATEVRFLTNELAPGDLINASRKIGVICWLPREKVEAFQAKLSAPAATN